MIIRLLQYIDFTFSQNELQSILRCIQNHNIQILNITKQVSTKDQYNCTRSIQHIKSMTCLELFVGENT